jgi:hypothetical protein
MRANAAPRSFVASRETSTLPTFRAGAMSPGRIQRRHQAPSTGRHFCSRACRRSQHIEHAATTRQHASRMRSQAAMRRSRTIRASPRRYTARPATPSRSARCLDQTQPPSMPPIALDCGWRLLPISARRISIVVWRFMPCIGRCGQILTTSREAKSTPQAALSHARAARCAAAISVSDICSATS